jgi:hypothetical protein
MQINAETHFQRKQFEADSVGGDTAMSKSKVILVSLLGILCFAAGVSVVRRNWGRNVGSLLVQGQPTEAEFIGRWQLQNRSLLSVTNRTGTTTVRAEVTLKRGGRFTATDFPVEDGFSTPSLRWRREMPFTPNWLFAPNTAVAGL